MCLKKRKMGVPLRVENRNKSNPSDQCKKKDQDIWLAPNQTSNEVGFTDRDSHWYKRSVKEDIHVTLHAGNISSENGMGRCSWSREVSK